MCGIAGILGIDDKELVKKMVNAIKHRGPDEEGYYVDENLTMGMCRLSIIDLKGGSQPIYNEEGDIVVIQNGEIYNYRELREELEEKGHKFYTNSDTEVIIHAYEEYGFDCLNKLNGMFAIAIWDSNKRRLFLARDRLGVKPLYYTVIDSKLIFASEIKAILEYPIQRTVCKEALAKYFALRYVPAPLTIFEGIMKLEPGHYIVADENGFKKEKYWELPVVELNGSESHFQETILKMLRESVKKRLVSDVPLGAFLSGGVDSSTVVAIMSELMDEPVKTFSVGFTGKEYDESSFARIVAEEFGTEHHEIFIDIDDINILPKIIWHFDEPIADAAAIPTYMLSQLARKKVKVVLTGEGGDEIFAGYERYVAELRFKHLKYISFLFKPFKYLKVNPESWSYKYLRFLSSRQSLIDSYITRIEGYHNVNILEYEANSVSDMVKSTFITNDYLKNMIYFDIKYWLPDDLLMKVDKMTMGNSLEAREPFLDYRLVEFAFNIPSRYKIKNGEEKYIFKKAIDNILPREIVGRKKHGFNVPIKQWFRESKDIIDQYMSKDRLKKVDYIDAEKVTRIWERHKLGGSYEYLLWKVLNYVIWWEQYKEK